MADYVSRIWHLRHFWLSLVKMDLRSRYSRSWLGFGWSLLHPIAMTIVMCTVFHKLFGMDVRVFGPFLLTGLCLWNYITACAVGGCSSLMQGEQYIRQSPAPIVIYSLRTVLGAGFHLLPALGVVIILSWVFQGFGNLAYLPMLIPALVLLFLLGWTLAIISGFANAYFPDTQHLTEIAFQILFYATPIIYPPEMLRERGMAWFVDLNPLAAYVQVVRDPILAGQFSSPMTYGVTCGAVALLICGSILTLYKFERTVVYQL
jgi:ABC-type polysaccharide/polyol phosphate export permease